MAPHALFYKFKTIPFAAQFCLPSRFVIHLVRTLHYFLGVFQDCGDGPSDLTPRSSFCTAAQMEKALRAIEGPVTNVAVRKQITLPDEPTLAAFLLLDLSLKQASPRTAIVIVLLLQQCRFHALHGNYCMIKADLSSK